MDKYFLVRPYAKAIFDIAMENNTLTLWSEVLASLANTFQDEEPFMFIKNPTIAYNQQAELLGSIVEKILGNVGKKFITMLAERRRLNLFPELATVYEQLCMEQENIVKVKVFTPYPLTTEQQIRLDAVLQQKWQKKVVLQFHIDSNLLGGIVISFGNTIIDGSLRNKLQAIKRDLLLN